MTKKRDVEILAPAGSTEQLIAAVNNGCDSVYLGLASFNARMKAPNFTSDNIAEWIDYCHVFGVKVYVAINTSLKNSEFDNAVEMLLDVYNKHADGVILTDTALIQIAAKLPKPFDIVASTQLNIHDAYGAEFLLDIGATTVVCARESDIDSIRNIVATGIKAECFIHGALCVCQSGQCLFSSMVGGNSGNRGLCAQPCRKKYSANGGEYKYLLSARDLCGLDVAKELYEAGVTTYKIEGRNRRAEYAGITSEVYGKLFDNGFNYNDNDIVRLKEIYNRDMSELTYLHGGAERIISPDSQNHTGVPVGIVRNGGIESTVPITKGDGFKIMNEGVEVCGGVALESGRGRIAAEFSGVVKNGMSVRRTTSIALCDEINAVKKRLSISLQFVARHGEHARLKAVYEEISAEVVSDYLVQQSQKIPTTVEEIDKQLRKTGNSYYTISDIDIGIDEVFLAKSQMNCGAL